MTPFPSVIVALAAASFAPLPFDRVGGEGGVAPEAVTALLEDRAGFVWIGSREGLLRYDGPVRGSLSNDSVYALEQDPAGDMCIGTQRGLNRLDRRTGRMERFLSGSPGLQDDDVTTLAVDGNGNLPGRNSARH